MTLALEWTKQEEFRNEALREWTVDGQVAGVTRSGGGLTYATISGAGHMVRTSTFLGDGETGSSGARHRMTSLSSRLSWPIVGLLERSYEARAARLLSSAYKYMLNNAHPRCHTAGRNPDFLHAFTHDRLISSRN